MVIFSMSLRTRSSSYSVSEKTGRRTQKDEWLIPLILHEQKKKQERRIPIYVQKDKEKAYENHRSPSLCGYRKGYQSIQENH